MLCCGNVGGTIVLPAELDSSRIAACGMQTGHDLDQRRFSRTILPKKGGDLAGADGNGNVIERSDARKVFRQVVGDYRPSREAWVGEFRRPARRNVSRHRRVKRDMGRFSLAARLFIRSVLVDFVNVEPIGVLANELRHFGLAD